MANKLRMLRSVEGIGKEGAVIEVYYDDQAADLVKRGICERAGKAKPDAPATPPAPEKGADKPPKHTAIRKGAAVTKAIVVALLASLMALPAAAATYTLKPSAATTASGTGDIHEIQTDNMFVRCLVTAGSGTVTLFTFFLGCSDDGTSFAPLPGCLVNKQVTSGAHTSAGPKTAIIDETAAVTTVTAYSATCKTPCRAIRGQWTIVGTSPSETFGCFARTS